MENSSAMQELYDALFSYCQQAGGFGVYDVLPSSGAFYPFAVLDSTQTVIEAYKIGTLPHEVITLQVFATRKQRKQLNEFIDKLADLRDVTTEHFAYMARPDQNTLATQTENVDNMQLLHATLNLHYVAYKQENKSVGYFK